MGVDSFGNSSLEIICHKKITGKGTILSLLFFHSVVFAYLIVLKKASPPSEMLAFFIASVLHLFLLRPPPSLSRSLFLSLTVSPLPLSISLHFSHWPQTAPSYYQTCVFIPSHSMFHPHANRMCSLLSLSPPKRLCVIKVNGRAKAKGKQRFAPRWMEGLNINRMRLT